MTNRLRTGIVVGTAAALGVFGAACSDDDNDGNQEIEIPEVSAPEVDSPDVEAPDVDVEGGEMPDVDVDDGD